MVIIQRCKFSRSAKWKTSHLADDRPTDRIIDVDSYEVDVLARHFRDLKHLFQLLRATRLHCRTWIAKFGRDDFPITGKQSPSVPGKPFNIYLNHAALPVENKKLVVPWHTH